MTTKLRVFVSSVQKELEDERLIVQNLVNTDRFLSVHCVQAIRKDMAKLQKCGSSTSEVPPAQPITS
jgi:hypothetical protein